MSIISVEVDRANEILSASIGADAHVDTLQRLLIEGTDLDLALPNGHVDYPRLRKGHVSLVICALWTPVYYPQEIALQRILDLLAAARRFCFHSTRFRIAQTAAAAHEIIRQGSIAMTLSLEGCDALGGNLSLLEVFREAGVSSITLTHVSANRFADASTAPPIHGGLSPLGRRAVVEMNRLGLLIDVSHCSDEAVRQVLEVSTQPVIASHSCCRSLCAVSRNLPDELIEGIAERGGVVCIAAHAGFLHRDDIVEITPPDIPEIYRSRREALDNYLEAEHRAVLQLKEHPSATLSDIADHIEHAAEIAGIDHVALGSDFDGGITPPLGFENIAQRPRLAAELIKRGHSSHDIQRIFGLNLVSSLEQVQSNNYGHITNQ